MILKISVILLSLLFGLADLFAEPPPISTCEVEGVIQEIRFEEEWCAKCTQPEAEYGCRTDMPLYRPAGYWLTIKIARVAPVEKGQWNLCWREEKGDCNLLKLKWCNENYPTGSDQKVFLEKDGIWRQRNIKVGRTIRGEVTSVFDRTLHFGDASSPRKGKELPKDSCYRAFLERMEKREADQKEAMKKQKEKLKPNFFLEIVDPAGNSLTTYVIGVMYESGNPLKTVSEGYLQKGLLLKPGTYDLLVEKGLLIQGIKIKEGETTKKRVVYDRGLSQVENANFEIEILAPKDKKPIGIWYHLYESGHPERGYCFCNSTEIPKLHLPPGTYTLVVGFVRKTMVENFKIEPGKTTKISALYNSETGLDKVTVLGSDLR